MEEDYKKLKEKKYPEVVELIKIMNDYMDKHNWNFNIAIDFLAIVLVQSAKVEGLTKEEFNDVCEQLKSHFDKMQIG